MKRKGALLLGIVCGVVLFAETDIPRAIAVGNSLDRAYKYGAKAKVMLKIVDELGEPVSGADVNVGFYLAWKEDNGVAGTTDTNGVFVAQGLSQGEVDIRVLKKGYYRSHIVYQLKTHDGIAMVQNGRWQPFGEERIMILKRIVNPIPMFAVSEKLFFLPKLNQSYGFDAVKMDLVQTFGMGTHSDICVEYKGNGLSGMNYRDGELILSWVDPKCGFYVMNTDQSTFKSPYHADTNKTLMTSISVRNHTDTRLGGIINDMEEKCIVYRIRPRFNLTGDLIGVKYGKIYGPIMFSYETSEKGAGCFRFTSYTNPTENDTNLEFLPYHSLNYPHGSEREQHEQPNIAP